MGIEGPYPNTMAKMGVLVSVCSLFLVVSVTAVLRGDVLQTHLAATTTTTTTQATVDAATGSQNTPTRNIAIRGSLSITGSLDATQLTSPIGNVKVSGDMNVQGELEATQSETSHFSQPTGDCVIKDQILYPKGAGGSLKFLGALSADRVSATALHTSFLEINEVRQWQLVSLEDFEEEEDAEQAQWSNHAVTKCAGNKFLGGPCTKAGGTNTKKTFKGLPEHTQLRITSKFLFIDSWDGESAYMKVDDSVTWADTYNHASVAGKGISICGNDTPEGRFMSHIDVTVPHTGEGFDLEFGATTDEHSCDESFGVDSVAIFVR